MRKLKKMIKGTLRNCGLDIHRFDLNSSPLAQIIANLRHFEIDLVLDVGANQGQFAADIREAGYPGQILSFEPLSEAHALLSNASRFDDAWEVHPRCALGENNGEVEINIAGNSASSSVLSMLDSHVAAAPESAYVGKEVVPLARLDTAIEAYIDSYSKPFLKIDTQGSEWSVLDGAEGILGNIKGVLLELSLIPLYQDQRLWRDIVDRMEGHGFSLWALQPEFIDPESGRTLQVNGIFFR